MIYQILITGANRGLGLAMTRQFLSLGHHVWTVNRGNSESLQQLQKAYRNHLHTFFGDMTDENSIRRAIGNISAQTDSLDMIINNAAVHLEPSAPTIESVDFSVYFPSFQVNSIAPLIVVKYALPLLRKGQKKLIANISSEAGSIGNAWRKAEYSYCMSKAALNMANQLLQNLLKPEGIRVVAVHPGWFSSDMGGRQAPITPDEAARNVVTLLLEKIDLHTPDFVSSEGEKMEW